jgi:hypothetical protein
MVIHGLLVFNCYTPILHAQVQVSKWQHVLQDIPYGFCNHLHIMSCQFRDLWLELFPVRSESGTTIVSLIDTCYVTASEVVHLFNAGLTQY